MGLLNMIRQRPDNQKSTFSVIMALVLTFFVVALWYSFSRNSSSDQAVQDDNKLSSISPLQVIKDEFSKLGAIFSGNNINQASSSLIVQVIPDSLGTTTSTSSINQSSTTTNINNDLATTSNKIN